MIKCSSRIAGLALVANIVWSGAALAETYRFECKIATTTEAFFVPNGPVTHDQTKTITLDSETRTASDSSISEDGTATTASNLEVTMFEGRLRICLKPGRCGMTISQDGATTFMSGMLIDLDSGAFSYRGSGITSRGSVKIESTGTCKVEGLRAAVTRFGLAG